MDEWQSSSTKLWMNDIHPAWARWKSLPDVGDVLLASLVPYRKISFPSFRHSRQRLRITRNRISYRQSGPLRVPDILGMLDPVGRSMPVNDGPDGIDTPHFMRELRTLPIGKALLFSGEIRPAAVVQPQKKRGIDRTEGGVTHRLVSVPANDCEPPVHLSQGGLISALSASLAAGRAASAARVRSNISPARSGGWNVGAPPVRAK